MSFRELSFLVSCFSLKCIIWIADHQKRAVAEGNRKYRVQSFFISFLIFSEFWNGILSSMVFSILSTHVNYKNHKRKLKCTALFQ